MQNPLLNSASTICFIQVNYLATVALSTVTESVALSTTTVSESLADAEEFVELPHEAKDTATIIANIKTNFFIFRYFKFKLLFNMIEYLSIQV